MTNGRINQVRTIAGPPHASSAELPMRGGPRGRSLASPRPAPPSASARSRRLQTLGRVSPRLGGACLRPGRGPSCPCGVVPAGARQPPACAALSLGLVQAASDARARLPAPRRSGPRAGLGAELPMRGGPLRRSLDSPRPAPSSPGRTASPPPSGSHIRSACASMRQAVARLSVLSGCVLRLGRRRVTRRPQPARFPWDGRPRGKTPPGYAAADARLTPRAVSTRQRTGARIRTPHGRPPARAWLRRRAELPHTICSGTMRACENGGPPPLPFSGGEERPPKMGGEERGLLLLPKLGGEERGLLLLPSRFREGRSVGRAGRRAAPAPGVATGCGTLADGRGGGMHRNRGYQSRLCRAAAVPRPPRRARRRPRPARPARSCAPSISAGMAPLAGARQWTPLQTGASQAQPAQPK